MPEENNDLTLYAGVIMCILAVSLLPAAGMGSTPGISGATGVDVAGSVSPFEDGGQVIIGVVAPLTETSSVCTPSSPCRVADLAMYQEQLSVQERAYLQILSEYAPDSSVAFYPVRSSDDTARTEAIHSLLSSGIDIIVEDIGSAYSPFMRKGALTDQISQTLSLYPEVSFGGRVHDEGYNIDILPHGMVDFNLEWSGEGPDQKNAEYYLDLIDRDTGKQLGLGLQSAGNNDTFSSVLSYQNTGTGKVRSQLRITSGSDVISENVRLSARITPDSVFIDDTAFFPVKGIAKEITQPEFVTITRMQQKGTLSSTDNDNKPTDASGSPVPTGHVFLISTLAPSQLLHNSVTPSNQGSDSGDTPYSSIYGNGIQWVIDLMAHIKDKILTKTSEHVTIKPEITEISGPSVLSKPGRYSLASDIVATDEVIIDIRSSGITIDGNGHMIEGRTFFGGMDEPVFQTGIATDADAQLSDIQITNIIISGTYEGIRINSTSDVLIDSCTIDAATQGIVMGGSDQVMVDSCLISSSGSTGIIIQDGKNSSIEGNTIEGGVNGIIIRDSENISLVSNEITGTIYSPVLEEGTNTNVVITD